MSTIEYVTEEPCAAPIHYNGSVFQWCRSGIVSVLHTSDDLNGDPVEEAVLLPIWSLHEVVDGELVWKSDDFGLNDWNGQLIQENGGSPLTDSQGEDYNVRVGYTPMYIRTDLYLGDDGGSLFGDDSDFYLNPLPPRAARSGKYIAFCPQEYGTIYCVCIEDDPENGKSKGDSWEVVERNPRELDLTRIFCLHGVDSEGRFVFSFRESKQHDETATRRVFAIEWGEDNVFRVNAYRQPTQGASAAVEGIGPVISVLNEIERFELTTEMVGNDDLVLQRDVNIVYQVVDDTNLDNASGWEIFKLDPVGFLLDGGSRPAGLTFFRPYDGAEENKWVENKTGVTAPKIYEFEFKYENFVVSDDGTTPSSYIPRPGGVTWIWEGEYRPPPRQNDPLYVWPDGPEEHLKWATGSLRLSAGGGITEYRAINSALDYDNPWHWINQQSNNSGVILIIEPGGPGYYLADGNTQIRWRLWQRGSSARDTPIGSQPPHSLDKACITPTGVVFAPRPGNPRFLDSAASALGSDAYDGELVDYFVWRKIGLNGQIAWTKKLGGEPWIPGQGSPVLTVPDEATRFALTTVTNDDLVYQESNATLYQVIDDTNLDNASGWEVTTEDEAFATMAPTQRFRLSTVPIYVDGKILTAVRDYVSSQDAQVFGHLRFVSLDEETGRVLEDRIIDPADWGHSGDHFMYLHPEARFEKGKFVFQVRSFGTPTKTVEIRI